MTPETLQVLWPYPGETLPVTVSRSDPTRLKVRWDDVPEAGEVARQQAEQLAAQMNQGGGGQVVMGGGADVSGIVEALQQAMPGAEINVQGTEVERGGAGFAPSGEGGDDDRVGQLERLARLRDAGALTDQEFKREKARILGA
ncbi:MAG: SHOCT domain-containing protein [Solirubrobacterales bacterium]